MSEKYYVEILDYIENKIVENKNTNSIVLYKGKKNIVKFENNEDKNKLIQRIKDCSFTEDKEIKYYLNENLPQLSKLITKFPIDTKQLKEGFVEIFGELPDKLFEEDSIFKILKNITDWIIKKNEIDFVLINISNGKLEYDDNYKYERVYSFYYRMMRLNHNLREYWEITLQSTLILERIFLSNIYYNDHNKIPKVYLNIFREVFNSTGKGITNFSLRLNKLKTQIRTEEVFLERTKLPLPRHFKEEKENLKQLIENIENEIDKQHSKLQERKNQLKELYEQRGYLTKEDIKFFIQLAIGAGF